MVVERSCYLDDALKKGSLRFRRGQPDLLPGFVGLEKMAVIELVKAFVEPLFDLVWIQSSHTEPADLSTSCEAPHNSILG